MRASLLLVLVGLCAGVIPNPVSATVIFETGFEPPGYATGTLSGQNGWIGTNITQVQTTTVLSGTQAAKFDARTLDGSQRVDVHALTYNSVGNAQKLVMVNVDAWVENSSGPDWDIIGIFGNSGFIGHLMVNGGTAELGLASSLVGSVAISLGQWHHFELDLNFATDVQSAYVDGTFIGSGAFATASTALTSFAHGQNSGTGANSMAIDNLSVTSAPEPASLALLGLGLAGLGFSRRRQQK